MPWCTSCGEELNHECSSPKKIESAAEECPLKKGALVVHTVDDADNNLAGITVSRDGTQKTTGPDGLATFDPLDPAPYNVSIDPLPAKLADDYDPPRVLTAKRTVQNGKIAYVVFTLNRRLPLMVRVFQKDESTKVFTAASVILTAESGKALKKDTNFEGYADFGKVSQGKYTIRTTLKKDDAGSFVVAAAKEIAVIPGYDNVLPIEAERIARPVIQLGKDAVAVKKKHGTAARQTLTLKTDHPFAGKGTFRCSSDCIRFYKDGIEIPADGGKTEKEFDSIGAGIVLEAEGVKASSYKGVKLEWKLDASGPPVGAADTAEMTVVDATIDIHAKSGAVLSEDEKHGDGRVIHVQNRAKERSRAKVVIKCLPAEYAGKLVLSAIKDNLSVFTAGGDEKALPLAIDAGAGKTPVELHVEGKAVSASKADTGLKLKIQDLAEEADSVKITVAEVKLEVCGLRPASGDPPPLSDSEKKNTGRELFLQGSQFHSPRALLRVKKAPHDAPCKLVLKAAADNIKLFPEEGLNRSNMLESLESHVTGELNETLPKEILPNQIKDSVKGLVFWAEGAKLTTGGKTDLEIDVKDVDDKCDSVSFTVVQPKLEIEVKRKDGNALSEVVKLELKEKDKGPAIASADIPKATGKHTLEIRPGSYLIALKPQNLEKDFRIVRTEPKDSLEAAVQVPARPLTTVKFELEPEPVYNEIQFISYFIKAGEYRGTDDPSTITTGTPLEKASAAAVQDMQARVKIMKEAVTKAYNHAPPVETASNVLKIFMAPEFYFRGKQGAYPIETVSKIMEELRAETGNPKYKDWLFVFGSALGYLERGQPASHTGTSVVVKGWVPTLAVKAGATPKFGWKLVVFDPSGTTVRHQFTITNISNLGNNDYDLTFASLPCFDPTLPVKVRFGSQPPVDALLNERTRAVKIEADCTTAPAKGWGIEQGTLRGVIDSVTNKSGNRYEIIAYFSLEALPATGTNVRLIAPGKSEIINIALVQKGGSGTPMKQDGKRSLNELLIYKEQISSVDFMGIDYGGQLFYKKARHLVDLHGNPLERVIPTEGSTAELGEVQNVPGGFRKYKDKFGTEHTSTVRVSEVNETGIGGGCVFTMNGITFGLEVCLDHGADRLYNYYDNNWAQAGEPKVQVQLIPSCGMSIDKPCCVPDGLVFNVDTDHYAAQDAGGTAITERAPKLTVTAPTGITQTDYFPGPGQIIVYEPQPTPTAATV